MNPLFIFIISYIITLIGYLLGKATTYEHKEIKEHALFFAKAFIAINYAALLYLSFISPIFFVVLGAGILHIIGENKFELLKDLNYLIVFALSFFIFKANDVFLMFSFVLFALIIENSLKKFNLKEIIASTLILILFYLIGIYL